MQYPLAYLITFSTYGAWLHGDNRGSVDKNHNSYGSLFIAGNVGLARKEPAAHISRGYNTKLL
ncbi:MAG TPA: hypothetical protein VMX13_09125 [Sedimentisphaerales bacterium]|nr:hypothetical protein [Sedimentisphaerales bacterium]